MQIIRSYFKNACPKSLCTAHPWLRKMVPVALPNCCPVSVSRIAPKPQGGYVGPPVGSLVERVELATEELVHREHVDGGLLEYRLHLLVAAYLTLVGGLLQVVCLDVLPQFFDDLRT